VKNAGISARIIIVLFVIKIVVGCLNGLFTLPLSYGPSDARTFSIYGWEEYQLLLQRPKEYFIDLLQSGYDKPYAGFFQSHNSYWNDLSSNIMTKLMSVFDIFSQGNFYINVILYNFITFFGIIALFRVFDNVYPNKKKILIVSVFLLPSVLYFSSIIHKEGVILAAIGIIVFNTYYLLNYPSFILMRIVYIIAALLFIFGVRNFVFIALLPALIAWIIVHRRQYKPLLTFFIIYVITLIAFFNISSMFPTIDPPQIVANRQADFAKLPIANTQLPMDTLYPSFKSFSCNAPQAINHSMMRPYFSDHHLSKLTIPFAIELSFYGLLILFFFFIGIPSMWELPQTGKAVVLFGIFFSISIFLLIGYIVPNIGTIVRYRAIYLPFIITPVLCGIHSGLIRKGYQKQLSRFFL
jgi:hypothetical protein